MNILILVVAVVICASNVPSLAAQTQEFQGEGLEQFLKQAKFTALKRIGQGVTNSEKVTLELDGRTEFGIWKIIDVKRSGVTPMDRGIEISALEWCPLPSNVRSMARAAQCSSG